MKVKILKGLTLKIDVSKAYDRVSWSYLQMLLTHMGFEIAFINWVMRFITNVSFVVLINGASSSFFHGKRGLHQVWCFSPLLFLLVVKGINVMLVDAK